MAVTVCCILHVCPYVVGNTQVCGNDVVGIEIERERECEFKQATNVTLLYFYALLF